MKVLVTGVAGFIGYHVARRLLERGDEVVGIDSVNDYYDPAIKEARLRLLAEASRQHQFRLSFHPTAILPTGASSTAALPTTRFDRVIHLAAQAGVRYSLENPHAYVESNIVGFTNMLGGLPARRGRASDLCLHQLGLRRQHATCRSRERDGVDHPLSLYAATKKANELMAHTYSHLFRLPTTGLRFFTVYGPWGRPDMALFLFTRKILAGEPIEVFNHGKHTRDFTYIDDIVEGVIRTSDRLPPAIPPGMPAIRIRQRAARPAASSTSATTIR